ncbi:hypothetical protein B566_EDAN014521 [Ephemera danica]|nr:hypothetical protein B566_EDAN014521 [Ephemera danica]
MSLVAGCTFLLVTWLLLRSADNPELPVTQQTTQLRVQQLPCPQGLVVTVQDGGRLGNKLFEYAAVWSLARLLNRTAYVPSAILAYLGHVFVNLSVPALESVSHCHLDLGPPLKRYQLTPLSKLKQRYRDRNILLHKWIVLPEPVLRVRRHLRDELQFYPRILSQVAETFRGFGRENVTYVGVHVRRTDFATFLPREFHTNLVTAKYFHRAMAWFREKLEGDVLFVVVSDDPEWCQRELMVHKDVVLAAKTGSAGAFHDLALLASCNHTIIDYGTYGTWGALLAGGHTIALGIDE